jgi:hypothetical protein
MRGLFRSVLTLCAVGLAMFGCKKSGSDDPSQGPIDAPFQAAFRVPGMT